MKTFLCAVCALMASLHAFGQSYKCKIIPNEFGIEGVATITPTESKPNYYTLKLQLNGQQRTFKKPIKGESVSTSELLEYIYGYYASAFDDGSPRIAQDMVSTALVFDYENETSGDEFFFYVLKDKKGTFLDQFVIMDGISYSCKLK